MRTQIPLEQFAGNVGALAAFAVLVGYGYVPGNAIGANMAGVSSVALGIGHYSALALLEEERGKLKAREDFLVAAAETQTDPTKALETLNSSADERADIGGKISTLDGQIKAERERRHREVNAPAQSVSEQELVDKTTAAADAKPPTPFKSLGEQLRAVHAAAVSKQTGQPVDQRLTAIQEFARTQAAIHGASELVGADGGFLVQSDLSNELMTELIAAATLAPLAKTREIGAGFNGVKFNVFDETSRATGSRYGGVRFYWLAEGGQKTASRPKMKQVEITLQKAAALYVATDELLEDTTALESFVRPAFVEEAAFWVDDAMIRGTGVGMPLGVLNADALVTVSKESGQAADTVVLENIDKMLVRMLPSSLPASSFYINQEVWPQLFQLAQVIGTGGVPVFVPPGGAGASPFGNLRGRPVVVTEYNSAIGDLGDIILADWKQYMLIRKGAIKQDSSIHVYFDTDETAFRWVIRVNGRPIRQTSLTPYKGSGTLSPFVTLQAR